MLNSLKNFVIYSIGRGGGSEHSLKTKSRRFGDVGTISKEIRREPKEKIASLIFGMFHVF